MSKRTRLVAGAAAAAVAVGGAGVVMLGVAGPASADVLSSGALAADASAASAMTADLKGAATGTVTAAKDGDDVNWKRVCTRVPVALQRVEKVQARFNADVNTPGSIAYLQARIDKAKAENKADVVQLLTDRMTMRKDLAGILPDRITQLKDAQALCAKHTTPVPAASATAS